MPGDKESSTPCQGQKHFVSIGMIERKRRREGPDQTKSVTSLSQGQEVAQKRWWVSRGFLPHSFTQPHLPLQSKEVHLSVLRIQNVFL